jgi:hypothetical protein
MARPSPRGKRGGCRGSHGLPVARRESLRPAFSAGECYGRPPRGREAEPPPGWGSRLYCAFEVGAVLLLSPVLPYLLFMLVPAVPAGLVALAATWVGLAACGMHTSRGSA